MKMDKAGIRPTNNCNVFPLEKSQSQVLAVMNTLLVGHTVNQIMGTHDAYDRQEHSDAKKTATGTAVC
jgi:hypothetical protein